MFFFKQKTAYEMRISDWSSDVCSSDLGSTGDLHCRESTAAGCCPLHDVPGDAGKMRAWKAGPPRQLRSEFCEGRSAQAEWSSHPDARLDVRNSLESATGQPGIPFRGSVNRNARLPSVLPLQANEVECRRAESFSWQQTAAVCRKSR